MSVLICKFSRYLENVFMQTYFRRLHLNSPNTLCRKYKLDHSKVPVLNEAEIEEQFVHGHGPGGQSVNKTLNCVVLVHKSMGITVKCHETRSLVQNRKRARELMIKKLDNLINGRDSLDNQKKLIDDQKRRIHERKRKKLAELKTKWKIREKLGEIDDE